MAKKRHNVSYAAQLMLGAIIVNDNGIPTTGNRIMASLPLISDEQWAIWSFGFGLLWAVIRSTVDYARLTPLATYITINFLFGFGDAEYEVLTREWRRPSVG